MLCGKSKCYLEVDHHPVTFAEIFKNNNITTFKEGMDCEKFWDTSNGRTLCLTCHRGEKAYSVNRRAYGNKRKILKQDIEGRT